VALHKFPEPGENGLGTSRVVQYRMDRRTAKRKIVRIEAELICGDVHCASVIENISPGGVYAIASPTTGSPDFAPETSVELKFEFPKGQKQHLRCRIKWSYKTPPHQLTSSIGMEIIEAPPTFHAVLESVE